MGQDVAGEQRHPLRSVALDLLEVDDGGAAIFATHVLDVLEELRELVPLLVNAAARRQAIDIPREQTEGAGGGRTERRGQGCRGRFRGGVTAARADEKTVHRLGESRRTTARSKGL